MLIDPKAETYVEENVLPQQNIHRLANGSIDYAFYDKRARTHRGVAFRSVSRSVTAFVLRLVSLIARSHPERQQVWPLRTNQIQAQPGIRRGDKRIEITTRSQKTYSEAA